MSENWTKALRGSPAHSTPRGKSYSNNRYGSKGATDDEVVDSADSAQKRTPRQPGMYDRPWKDLSGPNPASRSGTPRSRTYARPPLPRQNGCADGDDTASVAESDDVSIATEDDFRDGMPDGDSVQVFVRVRPINKTEAEEGDHYNCTRLYGDRTVSVELKHRTEPYQFKFDCVLQESTTQQEIFERAGKPIVDNCMGGYNSTIFAYGQTGAGKTYTMQGPLGAALQDGHDERGLAPRVFEYLFAEIDRAQDEQTHGHLTFTCRCSMLEIYNEVITDLLNPSATNLQIREDIKRGCYVEDLSEQLIQNVPDAMKLMRTGAENRHVGETRLNRESSRSHSVFACTLERHSKSQETGVTNVLFSRLNLIDLAGSERIHGGDHGGSQATGRHFREACHINKSLTTLGRVIMELVEAQRSSSGSGRPPSSSGLGRPGSTSVKPRHVPYRDSRLTFLLQDSLGGNAKTLMIANISPSSVSAQETLSTLHFMSRAKCIRNRATINLDARGDVVLLQREIVRLNIELDNLRKGYTEPAIQENKELREKLEEVSSAKGQMEVVLFGLEKDNQNLKAERRRLDHKMSQIQKGAGQLDQAIFSLTAKVMHHESLAAAATEKSLTVAQAEHELQMREMQEAAQQLRQELEQERTARKEIEMRLQDELHDSVAAAAGKVHSMQNELQDMHSTVEDLKLENDQLREQVADTTTQKQQDIAEATADRAALQQQLDEAAASSGDMQRQLEVTAARAADLEQQAQQLTAEKADLQAQLVQSQQQTAEMQQHSEQKAAELQQQLDEAIDHSAALQQQLVGATASRSNFEQQLADAVADGARLQLQLGETNSDVQALQQQAEEAAQSNAGLQQQLGAVTEARDEAQEALEVSRTVNMDLNEQIKQLMEQLAQAEARVEGLDQQLEAANSSISALQRRLDSTEADLGTTQQQIAEKQQEAAVVEHSRHELQQQLQQMQNQLEDSQQHNDQASERITELLASVASLEQQVKELEAHHSTASGSNEELQQKLAIACAEAAADKAASEAAMHDLQQKLEQQKEETESSIAQVSALEQSSSELESMLRDKCQALEAAQVQCQSLQQQLDSNTAAASAKAEQLSHDLAAARESSKSRQEELMKQVTEVHLQLSAAQQEQERLQDELDTARSDNGLLQVQLADLQAQTGHIRGQASQKAMDCDLLRKKLAAGEATISALRGEVSEHKQEVTDVKRQLKKAEAAAHEQQQKAAEELNALQRDVMDANELLTSRGFEAQQMQRRLEELAHRLSDKNAALDAQKEEVKSLKSTIAKIEGAARQRDALLAERTALSEQLQGDVEVAQARIHQLQEELASKEGQLRYKLNANELQLKEQIVYNVRNRQAMNEIRKVINWAQQAPTSTSITAGSSPVIQQPKSSPGRHRQQQTPLAAADPADEGCSSHSDSSSGKRSSDTAAAGQLSSGLPLMLESDEVGLLSGSASLLGAKHASEQSSGSERRASAPGDGMVSLSVGGSSKGKSSSISTPRRRGGKGHKAEADVGATDAGLQDSSCDYQDGLYFEDSKGEMDTRQLLIPEQASSPLRMSAEDSLQQLTSPKQRSIGASRNSRRGVRDASRKGGLRAGSDHFNFGAMKRHSLFNASGDSNIVLSVSGEWAAGGHDHQQLDMKLPGNIVGDSDVIEQDA